MTAGSFAELSRIGVDRFLQTVLVIDNELTLEAPSPSMPAEILLVEPVTSLKASTRPAPTQPLLPPVPENQPSDPESPLDAKQIMDAFLRRSLICGMHKPTKGDGLVDAAIIAARRSDAVIIDWLLDGSDPSAAKDIIAGIIAGDAEEQGRLRLVAVYTSEQDIGSITRQILDRLEDPALKAAEAGVLSKADLRIVVINKEGTKSLGNDVAVADLPTRIVDEFSKLTTGILGTFAVTAIAAVRRATHHVLAIFAEDLDAAFLGHMCALPSPEDAREFALDLLAGELRSVASMNAETAKVLAPESLGLNIDALAIDGKLSMGAIEVPLQQARLFPKAGLQGVKDSKTHQRRRGTNDPPSKSDAVTEQNVGFLFNKDQSAAEAAHHRFARFASFRTEMFDRTALPSGWRPTLSLGSLIVRLDGDAIDIDGYLLCTQPRCDAIRIPPQEPTRMFPFQAAKIADKDVFNLVAAVPGTDGTKIPVKLQVGSKPLDTRMILFARDEEGRVRARSAKPGRFEFHDMDEARYLWIGDLRDLAAQRTASTVAARMHEVGLDEYEWLRLKYKG
ncbi:MAG: response regulator receiver domain [Methylobacterium radiotolerans]